MSGRGDPSGASIAPLAHSQLQPMVDVLARAFCSNPINRAVVRSVDPERCFRSNRHSMRTLLPIAQLHGKVLVATLDGNLSGGLVASPPGRFPLPPSPLADQLRCLIRPGWQVARHWEVVFEALEALHPVEPHWYLGTLGVARSAQRRGVGAALLSRWLDDVDCDVVPAYLETDREEHICFYERAGFSLAGETSVLGVRAWCMKRPPAGSGRNN
ncbi:MAG TPA: GNAT family N-acetyltransferase [Myxococcota bacterium]